jgi:F0F1-type ATP synthase membrane subunit b/b'
MKRFDVCALLALGLIAVAPAFAQEGGVVQTKSHLSPTLESILLWVNFALLVGGLTYLAKKYGAPFLEARSQKITQDIVEAARVHTEAEARAAEADRRLANLESDLAAIRAESQKEIKLQRMHLAEHSSAQIANIRAHSEQEIFAAGKLASLALKRHSAELAVAAAGQKIQARMTPDIQEALVRGFVKNLHHPAANAQAN